MSRLFKRSNPRTTCQSYLYQNAHVTSHDHLDGFKIFASECFNQGLSGRKMKENSGTRESTVKMVVRIATQSCSASQIYATTWTTAHRIPARRKRSPEDQTSSARGPLQNNSGTGSTHSATSSISKIRLPQIFRGVSVRFRQFGVARSMTPLRLLLVGLDLWRREDGVLQACQ